MSKVAKNIVAVAKLLTSPVSAVASVFRKKKTVRRGRTVASAGAVRIRYKGRGGRAPTRLSNDGQGNVKMAKKIGRQPRPLRRSLEAKIRDMLNPASHHVIENSGNLHCPNGESTYTHFEMMNAEDIDQVIAEANAQGAVANVNGKLNIQNAKLQLMLRNQTTNLVTLRLYEYICRRDVPDKIQIAPGSGTEVDGETAKVIEVGFKYQNTANIDWTSIGGTLFQNPMFCTYYKIVKVRNIQLGAGKCMNLTLSNLKSKVINPLVYNATDGDVLAGHTRGFVVQAMGSLVGPSGDNMYGQPTTGKINIDWFCSRKYAYNQPYFGSGKNTLSTNLPAKNSGYYLNEFTGLAQEEKEA